MILSKILVLAAAVSTISARLSKLGQLTAHWELGNCGVGGNDHNWEWCQKTKGICKKTVTVDKSICPEGQAMLSKIWGGVGKKNYVLDGCTYVYYAQYLCPSMISESNYTGLKINRNMSLIRLGKEKEGPINIARTGVSKGIVEGELTFNGDIISKQDIQVNGTWIGQFIHRIMPTICQKGGKVGLAAGYQHNGNYNASTLECFKEWDPVHWAKQCATKGSTFFFDKTMLNPISSSKNPLLKPICCDTIKEGYLKKAGAACTASNFLPDVDYWEAKCKMKASAAEISGEVNLKPESCADVQSYGGGTGIHTIWPDGQSGSSMKVYCDSTTDGGGWTLVAVLDGNDEDHSNSGRVGVSAGQAISPGGSTRKYSDATINKLMNSKDAKASIKFICSDRKAFFKNCPWNSLKGLGAVNDCTRGYSNEAATSLSFYKACNTGSQGVGSHCTSPGGKAFTYCSHCDRGEAAGSHNRKGCGHDQWGYSKPGQLWVRGNPNGSGGNFKPPAPKQKKAVYKFDKTKVNDEKTRGCIAS